VTEAANVQGDPLQNFENNGVPGHAEISCAVDGLPPGALGSAEVLDVVAGILAVVDIGAAAE